MVTSSSFAAPLDPFAAPATTPIGSVRVRDRVAVAGTVTELCVQGWIGRTRALHATVTDDTGSLVVAFLGRPKVVGVEIGCRVTVAGAVIRHRGEPLIMNPRLWLSGCVEASGAGSAAEERSLVDAR